MRDIGHQPVLHGIEMNVIQMHAVILIVPDRRLPESSLPNPPLAFADPARGAMFSGRQAFGEGRLDRLPPFGEIRITLRQYHPCIDMEWSARTQLPHRVAQRVDVADKQIAAPVGQIDREEIGAARDTVSAIVGHRMVFAVAVSLGKPDACGDG